MPAYNSCRHGVAGMAWRQEEILTNIANYPGMAILALIRKTSAIRNSRAASYRPYQRLLDLGLIENRPDAERQGNYYRLFITAKGKEHMEECGASR